MGSEFESILDPQPEPVEPSLKTSEEELPEGVEHRFIDDDDLDLENIDQLIFETARSLARARLSRGSKKVTFRGDDSRESRIRASITKQYIKTIQAGGYTGRRTPKTTASLTLRCRVSLTSGTLRRAGRTTGTVLMTNQNGGIVESKKKIAHRSSASSDDTNGDGCVNREVTTCTRKVARSAGAFPTPERHKVCRCASAICVSGSG